MKTFAQFIEFTQPGAGSRERVTVMKTLKENPKQAQQYFFRCVREGLFPQISFLQKFHLVDINVLDDRHDNALMWPAYHGHKETCDLLIELGINIANINNDGINALYCAIHGNQPIIVRLLLQVMMLSNEQQNLLYPPGTKRNAIYFASMRQRTEVLAEFTRLQFIDCKNPRGKTALMIAVKRQQDAAAIALIKAGASLLAPHPSSQNPLINHMLYQYQDYDFAWKLLRHDKNIMNMNRNVNSEAADAFDAKTKLLTYANYINDRTLAQFLLDQRSEKTAKSARIMLVRGLMFAIMIDCESAIMRYFAMLRESKSTPHRSHLTLRLDFSYQDHNGDTPLHFACRYEHQIVAIDICIEGADLFQPNNQGLSAFDIALNQNIAFAITILNSNYDNTNGLMKKTLLEKVKSRLSAQPNAENRLPLSAQTALQNFVSSKAKQRNVLKDTPLRYCFSIHHDKNTGNEKIELKNKSSNTNLLAKSKKHDPIKRAPGF